MFALARLARADRIARIPHNWAAARKCLLGADAGGYTVDVGGVARRVTRSRNWELTPTKYCNALVPLRARNLFVQVPCCPLRNPGARGGSFRRDGGVTGPGR